MIILGKLDIFEDEAGSYQGRVVPIVHHTHVYIPAGAEGSRTHQPGNICEFCQSGGSPAHRCRRSGSQMFDIFSPGYQLGSPLVNHR